MLFFILATLFMIGISICVTPAVSSKIINETTVGDRVSTYLREKYNQDVLEDADQPQELEVFLAEYLPEQVYDQVVNKYGSQIEMKEYEQDIYDYIVGVMTVWIVRVVTGIVIFLLGILTIIVCGSVLRIIVTIPILRGVDRIAGAAMGALIGMFILWILFAVLELLSSLVNVDVLINVVCDSAFLSWVYENNLIIKVLIK